jgi:hypothetical protein
MDKFGAQRRIFLGDSLKLVSLGAFGLAAGQVAEAQADYVDPGPVPLPKVDGIKILFSGKQEEIAANWHHYGMNTPGNWRFHEDHMVSTAGDLESNEKFQNFQLHVEWREPNMPQAKGQGKGNSGVFLHGHHEIQVLDSYGVGEPGTGDCGALYSRFAPLVKACRPPLQWQTYDIAFRAARYENGQLVDKPRVTVIQNGILVQNNTPIEGTTDGYKEKPGEDTEPVGIRLQYHGNAVAFRNVWVLPLPEHGRTEYGPG